MTPETRRNVLRYGIAIDLVILATGAGMLLPAMPAVLLGLYGAAVLVSTWKGGWQGGLTALALSLVALATMFSVGPMPLVLFGLAAAVAASGVWAMRGTTPVVERAAVAGLTAEVPPVEAPAPAPAMPDVQAERAKARAEKERVRAEREQAARQAKERKKAEARAAREREARLAQEREEAERAARELEAQLAKEREEAEREKARLEEERIRAAQELEARLAQEREEAERAARELEAQLAKEREEAEREKARLEEERVRAAQELEARLAKEREEAERAARELEAQLAKEREEAEREKARLEEERIRAAQELEARLAKEREEAEREKARLEEERVRAAQELEARLAREHEEAEARAQAARELEAQLAKEREEAEREKARLEAARAEAEARAAREREEAERAMQAKLEQEREAMRHELELQLAAEREALAQEAARLDEAKRAAAKAIAPPAATPHPAAPHPATPSHATPSHATSSHATSSHHAPAKPAPQSPSLLDTVTGWFRREPRTRPNLATKRITTNAKRPTPTPQRRPSASHSAANRVRGPRLVLLERRRATADTILPKLRQRGIEVSVVERWVDAVDELLRVRPDAFLIDVEHPDFEKAHRTTLEKSTNLPIVLTGRSPSSAPPNVAYAAFATRPYDSEDLTRLAQQAMSQPDELLAVQMIQRTPAAKAAPPVTPPAPVRRPEPPRQNVVVAMKPGSNDEYEVQCFTCRIGFNAVESDWCSCLAKERTLVCTNCLSCFCKAPPAYKEKFWVEAPPRLFERKTAEARRQGGLTPNAAPADVVRPLVLTVEDDEEIQAIVQRVCANLGYGFIYATNGQDGLELAHEYRPNLILSDAFMPKLDGREMCRMLKDDPSFADTRMVVMTGLYTDTKYRSEALKRFHVDDYIAKPVAITDLINLLQRHLEGVTGLPVQDDLHELHRQELIAEIEDVPLADVLAAPESPQIEISAPAPAAPAAARPDAYEVCCANCEHTFDATRAEWCRCVGRDNTLVCVHCNGCFCKAPAAYKERFWIDAPPSLFERKMIGSKRSLGARANPPAADVKRPLILLVEDDENVQLIVRTVVTTMGFGFVVGANGQEGLTLAREYSPDLILSDAFMPKLDGREMCRLLKEDPTTSRSKAIIMTGLYTDRKYRNEALDYFKVDDYVAKPLAVDDLIKLFKKHLPQEVATAH